MSWMEVGMNEWIHNIKCVNVYKFYLHNHIFPPFCLTVERGGLSNGWQIATLVRLLFLVHGMEFRVHGVLKVCQPAELLGCACIFFLFLVSISLLHCNYTTDAWKHPFPFVAVFHFALYCTELWLFVCLFVGHCNYSQLRIFIFAIFVYWTCCNKTLRSELVSDLISQNIYWIILLSNFQSLGRKVPTLKTGCP